MGKIMPELREYEERLHNEQKATSPKGWEFITINPKPDADLQKFVSRVHRFCHRKMFDSVLYVFEQRGTIDKELGKGFHCHILAHRTKGYKPSKVKLNTFNSFKHFVGNEAHCDFGLVSVIANRVKYMTGEKSTPEKRYKQMGDRAWRKIYDLEPFYRIKLSPLILPKENAETETIHA